MRPRRDRAGAAAALALFVLTAIVIVITIGIRARGGELAFESRTLLRSCARWAAESAIERARADLAQGRGARPMSGPIEAGGARPLRAKYQLGVSSTGPQIDLVAEGSCAEEGSARVTTLRIEATIARSQNQWRVTRWSEGPLEASR